MVGGGLKHEITGRVPGAGDLGSDAAVVRLQCTVGESGPVTANRALELTDPRPIDAIVDLIDPFDVGPEPGTATEIEREMYAETAVHRNRR